MPGPLPGEVVVELAGGGSWKVVAEAPGFWGIPVVLGPREVEARLELLPTVPLEIRFEVPSGTDPPSVLTAEVRPAPGEREFPTADVPCPRAEQLWRCDVPAGVVDLKLSADGYVPSYLWGLRLEAGTVRRLDGGRLLPGASVSGFVTTTAGDPAGARVRVERALIIPTSEGREEALAEEAAVDERGFFLLAGVAPGEHVVTVVKEGYATARSEAVRVEEGSETRLLSPLHLERPVELAVYLWPPVDPWGAPWQVEVQRSDARSRRAHPSLRHAATESGAWSQPGLDPGPYRLRALDSRGSLVTERQIEVSATEPPVELDVDVVPVEGRVRVGEEPIEGNLILSGIPGVRIRRSGQAFAFDRATGGSAPERGPVVPDQRRMSFDADAEGRFAGYLPHEGSWEVEIHAKGEGQFRLPDAVEVHRPDDGGPAVLDLVVPDTRLTGRVLRADGHPVADATIFLQDLGTRSVAARVRSGTDGSFTFRGLPEHPMLVQARGAGGVSTAVEVEPRSGEPIHLELVIAPQTQVTGVVSSRIGPLPGVQVRLRPVGAGLPVWTSVGTRADGRFRLGVPAEASAVDVIVVAPGLPLKMARVPISATEGRAEIELVLEEMGGTLRLPPGDEFDPTAVEVAHAGAVAELTSLVGALMVSPELTAPDGSLVLSLEAGTYTICAPAPDCRQVFLSPGQTTELRLDGRAGSRGGRE